MNHGSATPARLIPELDVSDLDASLRFYTGVCGFELIYRRDAEQFAYLDLCGASVMLQAADGPGRRFRTAPLEQPYGRGINFQIQVDRVKPIYDRMLTGAAEIVLPLEDRWYELQTSKVCNRQFVVADPDGYLLRFFEDVNARDQQALVAVDESTLQLLVDAARHDADPDEVTPPTAQARGATPDWSADRLDWLKAFHRDRREGLDGPFGEATYAILVAGNVCGSIRLKRTAGPTSLEFGIWLRRSARGLGIGTVAVNQAVENARDAGCTELRAQTTTEHLAALHLLRARGFDLSPQRDGMVEAVLPIEVQRHG